MCLWHMTASVFTAHRFDLSGKCNNEAMKEELEEKRRAQVWLLSLHLLTSENSSLSKFTNTWCWLQVVAKLHGILRPFLLRRMKEDVEQMLPRKKEIILYATLTECQKKFHDHLVNKTLEEYLRETVDTGKQHIV